MSQQIELLRIGARQIALEKDFMSFVLYKYLEIEQISEAELILALQCSPEDFYRLALCKVPDVAASDFIQRLEKIAEYSNVAGEELNRIIKRIDFLSKLQTAEYPHSLLMAARDSNSSRRSSSD